MVGLVGHLRGSWGISSVAGLVVSASLGSWGPGLVQAALTQAQEGHLGSGLPGLAHWAKLSSVCFWISSARAWPGTGDLYSHLGMRCLGFRGLGVLPRGRGCPFWTLLSKGPRFRNSQIVKESRHHLSLQSFHRLNFLFPLPWFPRALVFSRSLLPLHEAGMGSWKA